MMTKLWTGRVRYLIAASAMAPAAFIGPQLRPETVAAWTAYVAATEARVDAELRPPGRFLATHHQVDADRRLADLRRGQILIDEVETTGSGGTALAVPGGMVHHWRGAVFIPGAVVASLVPRLQAGEPGARQPDVLAARVIERTPDGLRLFLRVKREKYLTAVYDTEHQVRFVTHAPGRLSTSSTAIRIVELEHAGLPNERVRGPGEDRGFLWRWQAYWRYEQVEGGVIAECESVSLSRPVPAVVRYLAGRLIRSTARESVDQTLGTFRAVFSEPARPTPDRRPVPLPAR